jgi:hypothetical protein
MGQGEGKVSTGVVGEGERRGVKEGDNRRLEDGGWGGRCGKGEGAKGRGGGSRGSKRAVR